jgi:hypothetical protein
MKELNKEELDNINKWLDEHPGRSVEETIEFGSRSLVYIEADGKPNNPTGGNEPTELDKMAESLRNLGK